MQVVAGSKNWSNKTAPHHGGWPLPRSFLSWKILVGLYSTRYAATLQQSATTKGPLFSGWLGRSG